LTKALYIIHKTSDFRADIKPFLILSLTNANFQTISIESDIQFGNSIMAIFINILDNTSLMFKKLHDKFFSKQSSLLCSRITFSCSYIPLILFVGLFTTILISTSTTIFVYSLSNSVVNITNKDLTNQSSQSSPISASLYSEQIPPKVKEFIINDIVNKSKAALVVGLIDPNGTKVYSFGNISKANNIPVNESTMFNIGSITKTFTTLLLADMVKQGIVNLNDPIEKYLPSNVKVPQYNGTKITLEDLATHTSGLPEWPSNIWLNNTVGNPNPNYTETQLYQALSNTTLTRAPGSQFQYSSFGIGLLGHLLSVKAGVPYEDLIKDRILDILGMNDTTITLSPYDIKYRFAVGHQGGKEIVTPTVPDVIAGAGELRSTAADMLKYASANLGFLHTKLDEAIQLQHLIVHPAISANPMDYSEYAALGWRVLTNLGTETLTHTGSINGWNAFVGFTPPKQIGVVLLCSCDSKDADMGNLGFVMLHLTGVQNLDKHSESKIHTTSGLS
jgi:serine-type D-Ala-D-Ala carboxypeptidase/endopeptidase